VSASDGGSSAGSPSPSRSPSPSPCPDRRRLRGRWRLRDARHGDRRGGARGRSGAHDLRDRRAAGVRGPGQARAVAVGERRLDPHRPRLAARLGRLRRLAREHRQSAHARRHPRARPRDGRRRAALGGRR